MEVSAQSATIGGTRTVVAVIRDITARKRVADELQHSEDRYRRLVELGPDAIMVHDGERILFANPAAVKLLGAGSVNDLIGLTPYALLEPESMEVAKARIRTLCETGGSMPLVDERFRRLDGLTVEAEVVSIGFRSRVETACRRSSATSPSATGRNVKSGRSRRNCSNPKNSRVSAVWLAAWLTISITC